MIDSFRSIFGSVSVKETASEIVVSGVRAGDIIRDMNKFWKTTKLTINLFNTVSGSGFTFYKFFAPEVMYMLENIKFYRNRWTSIKAINGIREAMMENTWLKKTLPVDPRTTPGRLNFQRLANLNFTAKEYQMEYFQNYTYRLDQYDLKGDLIAAAPGTGKAISMDANIKVLGGWKKMRDIQVGDMVTAWDGTQTKVIGVFPQGIVNNFTVTFKDGREINACEDHQWRVYSKDWKRNGDGWKILTTRELFGYYNTATYKNRLYIQLCQSEESPERDYPIDPYNFGAILGDGGISSNCVTLTSGDPQLFEEFTKALPDNLNLVPRDDITAGIVNKKGEINPYTTAIREMGLLGATSESKFIPGPYLHGSTEQRWALLQGLMDTDGTVDKNSSLSFCTVSRQLAIGVQYLVRSLGGIAKIKLKETKYLYKDEVRIGKVAYQINIRLPKPSMAFRLNRKLERCNDEGQYTGDTLKLKVAHVNIADRAEAQCISVEHPDHLYITDDFIVTHNTFMTSAIAEMLDADFIVVMCPKIAVDTVWIDSINEMFKAPQTIWNSLKITPYAGQRWLVCHYDQMDKIADIVRNTKNWQGKKVVTILDESHNMNDPNSARTAMYLGIVQALGSENNLQASGTPVKALGAEIITLLRTVDPMFTPAVEAKFRKMYGKEASKGLDIIRHRMGLVSFKIEKKELDLQPPIMRPYPITIPDGNRFTLPEIKKVMVEFIKEREKYYRERNPSDMKFWDQCVMTARAQIKTREEKIQFDEYLHLVHLISKTPDPRYLGEEMKAANQFEKNVFEKLLPRNMIERFRDVKSVVKYVRLKIQGEVLGRVVGGMRIEAHVAMVPYIDWVGIVESTEKKTIAFTTFVECVEEAERVTTKLGMRPATVYGKNSNELASTVKRFDEDKKLNPLIATYASLSTAVRLTMADTMILMNSPFRGYILEQAISRIFRMGQDSQTYVYQCVLDTGEIPNISSRSADILQWSQDQVAAIMGIKSPFVEGDQFGTAMENISPEDYNYDENEILHSILQKGFELYDIKIDKKDFIVPKVRSTIPAYMR